MQSNEELFFEDIISKKMARLSYYLPLTLISNSSWLRRQIRDTSGRDLQLLNPGIDTNIFYPQTMSKKSTNVQGKFLLFPTSLQESIKPGMTQ